MSHRLKQYLKPLMIATNIMGSDFAWLDTILITLVNLYHQFLNPTLNGVVCAAVFTSLEKHWAKADQSISILAVVLNSYVHASAFATNSPYCTPENLWELVEMAYLRFYGIQPNGDFQVAFGQYLQGSGDWTDTKMGLAFWQADADDKKIPVNLIQVWRESITSNGTSRLVLLATHILSIIPNTAATECLFSKFGIVHSAQPSWYLG
ncbi:hypothetical protein PAXRUDRAFT_152445 [Paxillus rubicundulus Ve08.2h10]|uniref:HAT C-terminal dimerisation domain-containing protein n=1 Tax=Paxillus rubicundulus Ve08.2h10 TaxID=930991 RepID=A0A0D0DBV9_9AGAM|nr:hypothetical protein PAXRUDRAFT_152445 [Paxillus rubicundulus Ve08.2h10]